MHIRVARPHCSEWLSHPFYCEICAVSSFVVCSCKHPAMTLPARLLGAVASTPLRPPQALHTPRTPVVLTPTAPLRYPRTAFSSSHCLSRDPPPFPFLPEERPPDPLNVQLSMSPSSGSLSLTPPSAHVLVPVSNSPDTRSSKAHALPPVFSNAVCMSPSLVRQRAS